MPENVEFNQGTKLSGTSWKFTEEEAEGLLLTASEEAAGNMQLTVKAVATDGSDTESTATTLEIYVNEPPEEPGQAKAAAGQDWMMAMEEDMARDTGNDALQDALEYQSDIAGTESLTDESSQLYEQQGV